VIDLRPRNIVELLDRTVSIAVRYFVPLFLLSVLVEGTLDVMAYANPAHRDAYDYFGKGAGQGGVTAHPAFVRETTRRIIASIAEPFQVCAIAAALGMLVSGTSPSVSRALRVAVRRYPSALAVGAAYAALVWGLEPLSKAAIAAKMFNQPIGSGPNVIVVGVVFGTAYLALRVCEYVAIAAATLEPVGPIQAALTPLRLFSNGRRIARMLGAIGMMFVFESMQGIGQDAAAALVARTIQSRFLYDVAAIAVGATETLLAVTFVTLFYYDARVRYDALDIQLALEAR
jgi:hypothetical protein